MPVMSRVESWFCRSAPWGFFAGRVVLPWVLRDETLDGEVLDVGGGSGVMARSMLTRFPAVTLTMVDVDPAMVSQAQRRLDASSSHARVMTADVTRLPFDDASFDVVTSHLMLHHVIEWQDAIAEFVRVLRPGGRLIGYDLDKTRLSALVHRLDGSPHRLVPAAMLRRSFEDADLHVVSFERRFGQLVRFIATK